MTYELLMIDDDLDSYRQVTEYLDEDVYVVPHARNPMKGIERAKLTPFDLIILDIQMVPLDGFDVIRRLQQNPRTKHIPIVIYSIVGDEDQVVLQSLGLGIDHIVQKGRVGSLKRLEARIGRLINRGSAGVGEKEVMIFHIQGHELKIQDGGVRVWINEREIELSLHQRAVLNLLATRSKMGEFVHSDNMRRFLYEECFGYPEWHNENPNNFYKFMADLKKRLCTPECPKPPFLINRRNIGYHLVGFVETSNNY